ncbi:MAG: YqgE/AlgH family protein [Nitrospirae bacterium]|nr:YqgE/AlgH family protein [Nitrospirota bacterium]
MMKRTLTIFILTILLAVIPLTAFSYKQRESVPLAKGVFLVSTPKLKDPHFYQTVILIVSYGPEGAFGIVINKPTDINVRKVLPDIRINRKGILSLYMGGPVEQNNIYLLFTSDTPRDGAQPVIENIHFTFRKDIVTNLLQDKDLKNKVRIYSGYTGWAPGQLEHEINHGAWITVKGDIKKVFSDNPLSIWPSYFSGSEELLI